jgi:hypothetical protein
LTAIHVLLVVAFAEVAIHRLIVPLTKPAHPGLVWTVAKSVGLFFHYFAGALAALVIISRAVSVLMAPEARPWRDRISHAVLGVAALALAVPLIVTVPAWTYVVEIAFVIAIAVTLATVFGHDSDLGIQVGLPIMTVPLLVHTLTFAVWKLEYPDVEYDVFHNMAGAPGEKYAMLAVITMSLAALGTPYCFAPRPFARAVTRPIPIIIAMSLAAAGAVGARILYPKLAEMAQLAIHVKLDPLAPDPKLALYLLAFATLAWTLVACATAASEGRRTVGAGLALIVLGGHEFQYADQFLMPLLGVALIADAARRTREQELEAIPLVANAPPIPDAQWSTFVGTVSQGLHRVLSDVHSLTTRGEGGLSSSLVIGTANGHTVRTRIERIEGSVVALDVVIGREIDELRGSTVTVWAQPQRGMGSNPPGPPAAPPFKSGDLAFDDRFRTRGNAVAFNKLFDDGTRARAIATLDGWLAFWDREGLRYRVYPGRGAPLDHPLPLSDLALGRMPANAERLVAVVELLVDVARGALEPPPPPGPPQELAS